jgi:hypothetical protein
MTSRLGALPTCPACQATLGWKESYSFWNPWNYPCPHCHVALEASRIQKGMAYAVVPAGMLLATILLVFEGIAFLAIVVPLIVVAAGASWLFTTFTVKDQ